MHGFKLVAALGAVALLAGCAFTPNLDKLSATQPTGGAFTQALAQSYKAAANNEVAEEVTGEHAEVYAKKGLDAAL